MKQFFVKQLTINKNGFTLIELITVLIILGVLSVIAIPKFIEQSSFEDFTIRDQLIARLKLVQLQAMNTAPFDQLGTKEESNMCHWLVIKPQCFYNESTSQRKGGCNPPKASNVCKNEQYNQYNDVRFTEGLLKSAQYRFNSEGLINSGSELVSININGENNLSITIEAEGYIHDSIQK